MHGPSCCAWGRTPIPVAWDAVCVNPCNPANPGMVKRLCEPHPFKDEEGEKLPSDETARLLREARAAEAERPQVPGRPAQALSS